MHLYEKIFFPLLRLMDPESAHGIAMTTLAWAQYGPPGSSLLEKIAGDIPPDSVRAFGLTFPNVLGVAAGFDKNVEVAHGLGLLGFGHVEVGTLTPLPQGGNPRPRLHRIPKHRALINSMGFPNCGVQAALPRLIRFHRMDRRYILGVSIGKQKETALAESAGDYLSVMRNVHAYADYLAINISSPNTPDLRRLQTAEFVDALCEKLQSENQLLAQRNSIPPRPLLVKVSPDASQEELLVVISAVMKNGLAGIIATNTTINRTSIAADPIASAPGGLSGAPLAARSNEVIQVIHSQSGGKVPIIGVGGIFTGADATAKLQSGASLLQVYTGMVYRGPSLAGKILREMK